MVEFDFTIFQNRRFGRLRRITFALPLIALAGPAMAQVTTATIYGTVHDPSGASVPLAAVRVTEEATGAVFSTTTNELGSFSLTFLPPGRYRLTVEAPGVRPLTRSEVQLAAGQRVNLSVALELGESAERILVSAETPLINAVNAEQAVQMESLRIAELPTARRDWTGLLKLSPGVAVAGTQDNSVTLNG